MARPSRIRRRLTAALARVRASLPARVARRYVTAAGPVLASGLAFRGLFALLAALWVAFAIGGLVVSGDDALRDAVLAAIRSAIPGLLDDGAGAGVVDPALLTSATVYGVTGAVALAGLLWTALGWLAAVRDAIRALFRLGPPARNPVVRRLLDLALGVALGALLLAAGGLSLAGTGAADAVLGWIGVPAGAAAITGRVVSLAVMIALYAAVLAGLVRWVAEVRVRGRILREGLGIGSVALAAIAVAGSLLIGGTGGNPLVASFAAVAGLLVALDLACQTVLFAAAWMAVRAEDAESGAGRSGAAERVGGRR